MKLNEIHDLNDLAAAVGENTSPARAIQLKCLDCCVYNSNEVRDCVTVTCPLHPFRLGKNPFRKTRELTEEERNRLRERLGRAREKKLNN